jgi:2-octaprenyl-6-methoxyphenol hydroxylase
LPLSDLADGRHRSAFVWSVAEADGPALMKLGERGFSAELAQRMGGLLGEIALIAPRQSYPLGYHRSAVITGTRAALVGDAAHGIHPIAGQGLNLGLRDVATLVEVLVEGARTGMDLGDAALLARYQRWRGLDSLLVAAATDGLTRLFGVPGRLPSAVRRIGLGAVQRSPSLKAFFMNEARGETGDLPKLLTGELV